MWKPGIFYHQSTANEKPLIAISACLSGFAVRYDGSSKHQQSIADWIAPYTVLQPLCPEADAGLTTPRPPVQLVQNDLSGQIEALGVYDRKLNISKLLHRYAENRTLSFPYDLCGFIFKSRSPSCGTGTTPLYDSSGLEIERTSGLFSQHCQSHRPWLIFEEEEALQSRDHALFFLWRIFINHDILKSRDSQSVQATRDHYQHLLSCISAKTSTSLCEELDARQLCQQLQSVFTEIDKSILIEFIQQRIKES